jgi:hypothetical protein
MKSLVYWRVTNIPSGSRRRDPPVADGLEAKDMREFLRPNREFMGKI